jgi:hypothetical protein
MHGKTAVWRSVVIVSAIVPVVVAKAISDKVDSASEALEPDTDGEYDCDNDRDDSRYDYD